MQSKICQHSGTVWVSGSERCFSHPLGRDENRAAHGNICYTEQCLACGAQREVNANQGHREHGDWGPSAAEREAAARAEREAARASREAAEDDAVRRAGASVIAVRRGGDDVDVLIQTACGSRWLYRSVMVTAAAQPDTGDGLVQVYSALLRRADEEARRELAS